MSDFFEKQAVLEWIKREFIVPVIRTDSAAEAEQLIEKLSRNGTKVFEITMSVPDAVGLIEKLTAHYGAECLIGAGTVLDAETARQCILAGAKFVVSPVVEKAVITVCQAENIAVMCGALTPTEILAAHRLGADVVKVFPSNSMGGAGYLKSLKAVFPQIEMMPTGGITLETAEDYRRAGAIAVGIGSFGWDKGNGERLKEG